MRASINDILNATAEPLFAIAQTGGAGGGGTPMFEILPPLLMVVGVLMIGVLLVVSIRGKIARRNHDTPSAREQIEAIKQRAAGSAGRGDQRLDQTRVDMVELSRQLASQLDVKAERLEQLIMQADERLIALHEESQKARQPGQYAESQKAETPKEQPMADSPLPVAASRDPLTYAVYELADAGCQPVEIAQKLDEQTGKVELILALRREERGG